MSLFGKLIYSVMIALLSISWGIAGEGPNVYDGIISAYKELHRLWASEPYDVHALYAGLNRLDKELRDAIAASKIATQTRRTGEPERVDPSVGPKPPPQAPDLSDRWKALLETHRPAEPSLKDTSDSQRLRGERPTDFNRSLDLVAEMKSLIRSTHARPLGFSALLQELDKALEPLSTR